MSLGAGYRLCRDWRNHETPRHSGRSVFATADRFPQRFHDLDSVRVEAPDGASSVLNIGYVRAYGSRLAIKFQGIDTPEHVARLRGHFILVSRDAVYPLPDNTFYVFELEGLPVETASGAMVGHVVEVLSYPANDVYVVNRNGEDVLIPPCARSSA